MSLKHRVRPSRAEERPCGVTGRQRPRLGLEQKIARDSVMIPIEDIHINSFRTDRPKMKHLTRSDGKSEQDVHCSPN
jgi:hypothetical protein